MSAPPVRPHEARETREPIRMPWLWVALVGVLLVIVPWWAPDGSIEPLVLGLPAWFVVSVVASLVFSGLTCWACLSGWNVVEDEEERASAEAREAAEGRTS
jgi:hypothetical protein